MARSYRLKIQKNSEQGKSRSFLTDGLIITGTTATLYLVTFVYEYGYCAYFGIPGFLIEPSTGTTLFSALFISFAIVFLIEIVHIPQILLQSIPSRKLQIRLVIVSLMWIVPFLMGYPFSWGSLINQILWTILLLGSYVYAIFFTPGPLIQRISLGEKNSTHSKSAWEIPLKVFGPKVVGLAILIYFAMLAAWALGTIHARFQEGFVVLKSDPNIAVIKRYGDRIIGIKYSGAEPQATGEFRVIDKEADMEFKNISNLKIKSPRIWIDPSSQK